MALFHKAERTRSRARLVYRADGGRSIALIPRVGLALCNEFVGKLFWKSPGRLVGAVGFTIRSIFVLPQKIVSQRGKRSTAIYVTF
jgi:hypothetical protein